MSLHTLARLLFTAPSRGTLITSVSQVGIDSRLSHCESVIVSSGGGEGTWTFSCGPGRVT